MNNILHSAKQRQKMKNNIKSQRLMIMLSIRTKPKKEEKKCYKTLETRSLGIE